MVKIVFKMSDVGSFDLKIAEPTALDNLLQKCAENADIDIGGYIAVRNGKVLSSESLININDIVDIFPAISGG